MNTQLQNILQLIQHSSQLNDKEKAAIENALKEADKALEIVNFKLERTEKVKRTTGILLEETIEELEQKRKAVEAQNRELEIEASLERVRSQAMSMHKPDDLLDICQVIYTELHLLGFTELRNAMINIYDDDKNSFLNYDYAPNSGKTVTVMPYNLHPLIEKQVAITKNAQDAFFEFSLAGDELSEFRELRKNNGEQDDPKLEDCSSLNYYFYSIARGSIGISTYSPITEHKLNLLKRFRNVFNLSYQRYTDIAAAEAQAREARIEASLERTRTQSMRMQHSNELDDTLRVFHEQVLLLGIKSAFSFLWLPDEENDRHIFWAAWAENNATTFSSKSVNYPLDRKEPATAQCLIDWKSNEPVYSYHVPPAAIEKYFAVWSELIVGAEHLKPEYFNGGLYYVEAFMKYGCFGVIVKNGLSDDEKKILARFAIEFERAYTRFLDLKNAEAHAEQARLDLIQIQTEKKRAEDALLELQVTQKQLIQSEKMASLGELTAGIAHEIQNPLNFVNNFSDVSMELLDEMKTELDKGNTEDAKDIANDVILNLGKINHHGKRADAIVKGMLQHSRSSTGVKEPTDINALCDEFIRLSYHGLRAKDKSFNATIKTDFDPTLEKINIIPQDIGRVVLNLLTNAFYVVNEKNLSGQQTLSGLKDPTGLKYEPTVAVTTKKTGDKIIIKVSDNGNGIPQKILDKIFQPFFTTKPTGQGTGLGLSLSYDIVTKGHGGELKVETKEGEGTSFILSLPA